ncbi:MAG: uncharacterized protein K0Q72_5444 [Armatimonadetes bacterium]|jgi:predicted Zn-dependent protease|nr:uncharacterized protein [Armatimonadota bacterium]
MLLKLLGLLVVGWPLVKLVLALCYPNVLRRLAGRKAQRAIEEQYGRGDRRQEQEVARVGHALATAAGYRGAQFYILRGPTCNAVALPNGRIYVWEGLLRLTGSDPDRLAGVLAHELGHLECDHFLQRARFALVLETTLGWLGGSWVSRMSSVLIRDLLSTGFSRAQEREADDAACRLLKKAGRSPEGLASLLEALESGEVPSSLLGTHPAARERAAQIRTWMRRTPLE